jgi:hypothetical protein
MGLSRLDLFASSLQSFHQLLKSSVEMPLNKPYISEYKISDTNEDS